MTDPEKPAMLEVPAFYDRLAPDYDEMTGFEKRFAREKPFFHLLVEKYRISSALDAGCGTGFHSLLLAQLGVRVTAVDVSQEMLDRLKRHSMQMNLEIKLLSSSLQDVVRAVDGGMDAVFCMGNTLPHLLSEKDIRCVLGNFASILRPGGLLFMQMLNYDRIFARKERMQSVRESNGVTYVRSYDFEEDPPRVLFNILRIPRQESGVGTGPMTVRLLPITSSLILKILTEGPYEAIRTFGSIAMDPYDPAASGDLVISAIRV